MPMIPLVLAAALLFQQQVPRRLAPGTPQASDSVQAATVQAITEVGRSVADMRSAHEFLRRAAFNQTEPMVVERAQQMQQRCRDLTTVARAAVARVCRRCFAAAAQRALNAYRGVLPSVGQVGTRCANQLGQMLRARDPAAAVRRNVWSITRTIVQGLLPYEARVQEVRQAFNLVPPPHPARR